MAQRGEEYKDGRPATNIGQVPTSVSPEQSCKGDGQKKQQPNNPEVCLINPKESALLDTCEGPPCRNGVQGGVPASSPRLPPHRPFDGAERKSRRPAASPCGLEVCAEREGMDLSGRLLMATPDRKVHVRCSGGPLPCSSSTHPPALVAMLRVVPQNTDFVGKCDSTPTPPTHRA